MVITLRCSQLKPFVGFDPGFQSGRRRLCQAKTVSAHAEHVLSARITKLCRFAYPHHGSLLITRKTLASVIHHPEVELGQSMALVGCLLVPMSRLQVIGFASLARKAKAKAELRFRIARFGQASSCW